MKTTLPLMRAVALALVLYSAPAFSQTCPLLTHNPFTDFNSTPNPQGPTTLWVHIETKLANTNLTSNGDYLLFTGGTVTLTGITSTPMVSSVPVPNGKIIADNTVSQPVTTFDLISNTWITRVPLGYSSSDIFISAAIINSSTGFTVGAGKSSTVTGMFVSNKTSFKQSWIYGLATFRPEFAYSDVAGPGQVASVGSGGGQAGTPIPEKSGLVAGGSGGGGSNFTGSNSSTDTYNTCQKTCNLAGTIQKTDVFCHGGADGTATVTLTGGTPPFTLLTNGGPYVTSNLVTPFFKLAPGVYPITVTDAAGCSISLSVTITEPPALQVSGLVVNATNNSSNGSITVNVTGGTPPYGFIWNTGATTENLTGIGPGTYSLTVTDAHGCTAGLTELLNGTTCTGLNVSATVLRNDFDNSCDGEATITVTGGTGPFTYSWSDGVVTSTNTRDNLCGPPAGSGTPVSYTVVVTDASGCSGSASFIIDVSSASAAVAPSAVNGNANTLTTGKLSASVYPNPSNNLVNVQINATERSRAVVNVIDLNGRIVKTFMLNLEGGINSRSLQLPATVHGLYMLQIKTSKEVKTLPVLLN